MTRVFVFIILIFLSKKYTYSQYDWKKVTDSLKYEIYSSPDESTTLNLLEILLSEIGLKNIDSAKRYNNMLYSLASKNKDSSRIASFYINKHNFLYSRGYIKEAKGSIRKITEKNKFEAFPEKKANAFFLLALLYEYDEGKYDSSIWANKRKLYYNSKPESLVDTYTHMAKNFQAIGKTDSAVYYYIEAEKNVSKIKASSRSPYALYLNYSFFYSTYKEDTLSSILYLKKALASALSYEDSLFCFQELSDYSKNQDTAIMYSKISYDFLIKSIDPKTSYLAAYRHSYSFMRFKELDSAEKYLKQALNIAYKNSIQNTYKAEYSLGVLYFKKEKHKKALNHFVNAFDRVDDLYNKYLLTEYIYKSHIKLKNYKEALDYHLKHTSLKDSIFNEKKHKQIAELETKYETEKKDREIESLASTNAIQQLEIKQKNTYLFGTIGLLFLLGLAGFLLFRQNKIRQEQKTSKLEQKLLRTQMNPHFMSNALASIQMYMYKNNPKDAARYLGKYGKLTRQILEASRKDYISLEDELNILENYLAIQHLIAPKPFEFIIKVDEAIDKSETLIPPMIAQPFIENAIKHGLEQKQEDDRVLLVEFKNQGSQLLLNIIDNGVGRNIPKENKEEYRPSYATIITNERIGFLKKKHKQKISFNIIDLVESNIPKGTKVEFKMPLIYNV